MPWPACPTTKSTSSPPSRPRRRSDHQLAAGEVDEVHGRTLAQVQTADAHLTSSGRPTDSRHASPADVATAIAEVNQRLAEVRPTTDVCRGRR